MGLGETVEVVDIEHKRFNFSGGSYHKKKTVKFPNTFSFALLSVLIGSSGTSAISISAGSSVGVMTQPTSSYYHGVYGGFIDAANTSNSFIFRALYYERPRFQSEGYIDQEYGYFGQFGTYFKQTGNKDHGLSCLIGYGRMNGYLATSKNGGARELENDANIRRYSLPGPIVTIEYGFRWKNIRVSILNSSFTGIGSLQQFAAKVAWPYTFTSVSAAYNW